MEEGDMAGEMVQNSRTYYKSITFNEHDHIQQTQTQSHSTE